MLIEKYVVATPPETAPVDFGVAVKNEARRRGLGRARCVYLVMDGAIWLWDLAQDRFAQAIMLWIFIMPATSFGHWLTACTGRIRPKPGLG